MLDYVGNNLQVRGAEQYVLFGGKGNGMRFLFVRNGLGLEAAISLDRCADISRLTFKGSNLGYFSPCGYVSSGYYDIKGNGFLKSFTGGFFTTCGLTAAGAACTDEGEELPLHGTIGNTPAELKCVEETETGLTVRVEVRDCVIFGNKMVLRRKYVFSYESNTIVLEDSITNESDHTTPLMILYHCNTAYPLLDETSDVRIPNTSVKPRNARAASQEEKALQMELPQAGYEECCYYYDVKQKNGVASAGIYNEKINAGLIISFEKAGLPYFTEWKMMGKKDYVLGLEPGNCTPDGRDILRSRNELAFLRPDETSVKKVTFEMTDNKDRFNSVLSE